MSNSVKHPSSKYSREVLFIWLRVLTWKDSHKFAASVVFLDSFVKNIPKSEQRRLSESLLEMGILFRVLFKHSIQNLSQLGICRVAIEQNLVGSCWWDLYLSTERGFLLVALMLSSGCGSTR